MEWIKSSSCESNACVEVAWNKSSKCDTAASCVEVAWHKSSLCDSNGGNCVEVGVWKKSTRSGPHDDNCVEVAGAENLDEILVRHSKEPDGPMLRFTPDEWVAFIAGVKDGEFDA
jgi:hypothetical protein